ncbi:MAG: HAMP domain-containing protein [Chloroflexi bacterium]|nr:HAMP domain-containing protein [Chloroflexota bacterium]
MLSRVRQHLSWKIFISYLVVISVGIIVLATSAKFAIPAAFDRHMGAMIPMMGDSSMGMMDSGMNLESDLYANFSVAVNEALTQAALAAFITALVVSWFFSRQVVIPVRGMMAASKRIAEGHYDERVQILGDPGEADELSQLAISFNRMAKNLAQTENMRRLLIGDVTHELRTPLTIIKGSIEGLIDGVLPPEAETYQQIYREADRLTLLVDDLQELSRVEAGAYALNRQPVHMADLVSATVARLGRQFEEKDVGLDIAIPAELPRVLVDEDRLGQVLINLLGNALQYTPSGGRVWITAAEQGGEIEIAVRDTGIGIALDHLQNLFTRFYRVDKSRSRAGGGSGIGLTIAKHFVEAHGGRIWAESEGAGKGSAITFTLPLAK